MTEFRERVLEVLRGLQPGEVVTYGEVAREAGYPGAARAVGNLLRGSEGLPWWRVVRADGRLVPGLEAEQARRLAAEAPPNRGSVDSTPPSGGQSTPQRRGGGVSRS